MLRLKLLLIFGWALIGIGYDIARSIKTRQSTLKWAWDVVVYACVVSLAIGVYSALP